MLFSRKKPDPDSVDEFVRAVQNGETEAFGKIYDNFIDQIYRFVYFKVGDAEMSADLTQTIFLRAFERIGSFRGEGSFTSWLFAIARNSIVDHYRSRSKTVSLESIVEPSVADNTAEFESRDLLKQTLSALKDLNPEEQEVITLSCIEEYSFAEISKVMTKSEGALRILKHRALKKLSQKLKL